MKLLHPLTIALAVGLLLGPRVLAAEQVKGNAPTAVSSTKTVISANVDATKAFLAVPTQKLTILRSGIWRSESPGGHITISDPRKGQHISLNAKTKTAHLGRFKPEEEPSLLQRIENLPAIGTVETQKEEIDGKDTLLMIIGEGDDSFPRGARVWIDATTKRPLRIEMTARSFTVIFSDIRFEDEIDMELFSLDAPPGYRLEKGE